MKSKISKEDEMNKRLEEIKSLIKVWPFFLQKRQVLRDTTPKTILEKAAKILKCNTNDFLQSPRICHSDKLNRDLLIYILWNTGWYNNKEIGNLFGLGYSSISRRVTIMKSMILKDGEIHKQLEEIKSLFKVWSFLLFIYMIK